MPPESCLFCRIASGEIDAEKVYEDEHVVAFKDINPQAPTHLLVIPRKHIPTLADIANEDQHLMGHMMLVVRDLAVKFGVSEEGYRLVVNCRENGLQTVFHIHFHLLGGRKLTWPPG